MRILTNLSILIFSLIFLLFNSCGKNNLLSIDEQKVIEYEYDGHDSSGKVRRHIKIKITPALSNNKGANSYGLVLKIKNIGSEEFIMSGEDIFLINSNDEIITTLDKFAKRVDIKSGRTSNMYIQVLTIDERPYRLDFRKRLDDKILTVFSINTEKL